MTTECPGRLLRAWRQTQGPLTKALAWSPARDKESASNDQRSNEQEALGPANRS
jgi:hypothetical protein